MALGLFKSSLPHSMAGNSLDQSHLKIVPDDIYSPKAPPSRNTAGIPANGGSGVSLTPQGDPSPREGPKAQNNPTCPSARTGQVGPTPRSPGPRHGGSASARPHLLVRTQPPSPPLSPPQTALGAHAGPQQELSRRPCSLETGRVSARPAAAGPAVSTPHLSGPGP